jgi:hypothetical protein
MRCWPPSLLWCCLLPPRKGDWGSFRQIREEGREGGNYLLHAMLAAFHRNHNSHRPHLHPQGEGRCGGCGGVSARSTRWGCSAGTRCSPPPGSPASAAAKPMVGAFRRHDIGLVRQSRRGIGSEQKEDGLSEGMGVDC